MKRTFTIELGEEDGEVFAIVRSLRDKKERAFRAPNMRLLMAGITKMVRKRNLYLLRLFQVAPPSPIVTLDQDADFPRIITPGSGNGH